MANRLVRMLFDGSRDPKRLEEVVALQGRQIDELLGRVAVLKGKLRTQRMALQRRVVEAVSRAFEEAANDER